MTAVTDLDPIEVAAEESVEDWRALVGGLTDPIEQLVDGAASLEEVRDGLAGLIEKTDVEPLREQLARATFAGRLAGDAAIGNETGESIDA